MAQLPQLTVPWPDRQILANANRHPRHIIKQEVLGQHFAVAMAPCCQHLSSQDHDLLDHLRLRFACQPEGPNYQKRKMHEAPNLDDNLLTLNSNTLMCCCWRNGMTSRYFRSPCASVTNSSSVLLILTFRSQRLDATCSVIFVFFIHNAWS